MKKLKLLGLAAVLSMSTLAGCASVDGYYWEEPGYYSYSRPVYSRTYYHREYYPAYHHRGYHVRHYHHR